MIKNIKQRKYEKGQTLLFVIVAVTIALVVGVSVSTRTISSIRRVSRTDTSTRVIAAAEGGIENLLGRTYLELDTAIIPDETTCADIGASFVSDISKCIYDFTPDASEGDVVSSRAVVQVEKFNSNEEDNGYSFNLEPGSIREVFLWNSDVDRYIPDTIQICWESEDTVIYYYSYNPSGGIRKGGLYPAGFTLGSNLSGIFTEANNSRSSPDYPICENVSLVDSPYGLRIKVLYNPSKVAVFPVAPATELPTQGYKLTSRGEITTGTTGEGSQEQATVIVHKTYPRASDIFDYGIYTPYELR